MIAVDALMIREIPPMTGCPPPARTGLSELTNGVVDRLAAVSEGCGLEIHLPPDIKYTSFHSSVRNVALSRGIGISARNRNGRLFLYRVPLKVRDEARLEEIAARRVNGETLEAIADSLGITRERVRQLEKLAKFSTFSPDSRSVAVDTFIAPYLENLGAYPTCIVCGEGKDFKFSLVCPDCRKSLKVLRDTASRLRAYRDTGKRYYVAQAIQRIRKNGFTPEDLKRG